MHRHGRLSRKQPVKGKKPLRTASVPGELSQKRRTPLVLIHQEVFHGHPQQPGQGKQVIHRGQALTVLPLVDGLRVFKPEVGLKIPHGQSGHTALPFNAVTRLNQVNDRICSFRIHRTILPNNQSFSKQRLFKGRIGGGETW